MAASVAIVPQVEMKLFSFFFFTSLLTAQNPCAIVLFIEAQQTTELKIMIPTPNKFVVQSYSNVFGWFDSRYSSECLETALQLEIDLLADDKSWAPGKKRQTRIADRPSFAIQK